MSAALEEFLVSVSPAPNVRAEVIALTNKLGDSLPTKDRFAVLDDSRGGSVRATCYLAGMSTDAKEAFLRNARVYAKALLELGASGEAILRTTNKGNTSASLSAFSESAPAAARQEEPLTFATQDEFIDWARETGGMDGWYKVARERLGTNGCAAVDAALPALVLASHAGQLNTIEDITRCIVEASIVALRDRLPAAEMRASMDANLVPILATSSAMFAEMAKNKVILNPDAAARRSGCMGAIIFCLLAAAIVATTI